MSRPSWWQYFRSGVGVPELPKSAALKLWDRFTLTSLHYKVCQISTIGVLRFWRVTPHGGGLTVSPATTDSRSASSSRRLGCTTVSRSVTGACRNCSRSAASRSATTRRGNETSTSRRSLLKTFVTGTRGVRPSAVSVTGCEGPCTSTWSCSKFYCDATETPKLRERSWLDCSVNSTSWRRFPPTNVPVMVPLSGQSEPWRRSTASRSSRPPVAAI